MRFCAPKNALLAVLRKATRENLDNDKKHGTIKDMSRKPRNQHHFVDYDQEEQHLKDLADEWVEKQLNSGKTLNPGRDQYKIEAIEDYADNAYRLLKDHTDTPHELTLQEALAAIGEKNVSVLLQTHTWEPAD